MHLLRSVHPIGSSYLIVTSGLLFLWPMILGFHGFPLRAVWVGLTLIALLLSTWGVMHFSPAKSLGVHVSGRLPWLFITGIAFIVFFAANAFPPTFFGDETSITVPAMTLAYRLAGFVTWPGLIAVLIMFPWFVAFSAKYFSSLTALFIATLFAGIALTVAWFVPQASTLSVAYPPLMHAFELAGTILTVGSLDLLRSPNALWTLALGFVVWNLAPPSWNAWAKYACLLALLLTPMGWTYRLFTYQMCGEITLGIALTFLLTRIIQEEKNRSSLAVMTGILLSMWNLYRPTSLAILAIAICILLLFRRWKSISIVTAIAAPLSLLSLVTYWLGTYQFDYFLRKTSIVPSRSILRTLELTVGTLPDAFHWIGLSILILGSITLFVWRKEWRTMLIVAWLIGIGNTLFHHVSIPEIWVGYARFSVLMMLPLGVVLAGISSARFPLSRVFAVLLLAALAAVTPWRFSSYLHDQRTTPLPDMLRSVTAGEYTTAIPWIVRRYLEQKETMVIIQPDNAYLDLFIPPGLLTVDERSDVLKRSREWSIGDPAHPLIIQPPMEGMTFRPNISVEQEQRILEIAAWARTQPNVEIVRWGRGETLIVP